MTILPTQIRRLEIRLAFDFLFFIIMHLKCTMKSVNKNFMKYENGDMYYMQVKHNACGDRGSWTGSLLRAYEVNEKC